MAKRRATQKGSQQHQAKVFISYSHRDRDAVRTIVERLRADGHDVWIDSLRIVPGDNIPQRVLEGVEQADAIVFVISRNSLHSEWVQREFSAIALQDISKQQQRIIPVRLDDCELPSYLADRQYIDFSSDFGQGLRCLSETLALPLAEPPRKADARASLIEARAAHVARLKEFLRQGRLTLFCGAGISLGAGIPTWNKLLATLLASMMKRISSTHNLDVGQRAAEEFQKRNGASALILGKYLKNNLGRDFSSEVRNALYLSSPRTSPLIDSIVTLSRPQRDGRPLDSIVTFNFDCLLEENLTAANISNRAICSEAISHNPNEIPVYHVHGFLPRTGLIAEDVDVVFSEDAYHSQFIDPFSWSNLIQLNKLTQNTCLFVGISLTDPNMRRLLDVAWRKNPEKRMGHYIAKRLPQTAEADALDEVSRLLEEQDANALGLNVIWMESYEELPGILGDIASPLTNSSGS